VLTFEAPLELDIYVPSLALAFEYQGTQHYHDNGIIGEYKSLENRDQVKLAKCQELGITLIQVPYWWKMNADSLATTIHLRRPDVIPVPPKATPISLVNPKSKK
jgi:hypothetical protein